MRTMLLMWTAAVVLLVTGVSPVTAESPPAGPPPYADPLPWGMAGVDGEITRLYLALLDRAPESDGRRYWTSRRQDGASLRDVVAFFRHSPEFEARFGQMIDASTGSWVEFMYQQVLGRPSDIGGKAFWVDLVDSDQATKEDLIIYFSESPEFQIATGTGLVGFLHLVDESDQLYATLGDNYQYESGVSSYWQSEITTLVVIDGMVVERHYESHWHADDDPAPTESWTETEDDIGSHANGAEPVTVDIVHQYCRSLLQTLSPWEHELALSLDDDGKLASCGGDTRYIEDDAGQWITIQRFITLG
jgi:hypothetical protein